MTSLAVQFESTKQDWETPSNIFHPLNDEFHFTLDAAASAKNAKAPLFITEEENGLETDWGQHNVWVNPPFGKGKQPISKWVKKAFDASTKGATCVLLVPARTNTNWFHDICFKHGEVRFIRGRPNFAGAKHGLPWPLCIVIFRAVRGPLDKGFIL